MKFVEIVKEYWNAGLTVVPFNQEKKCLVSWKKYQTERPTLEETIRMFSGSNVEYIALICKDNIEAIDIDAKNNMEGQDIAKEYANHLKFFRGGKELLKKLLIEKTKNNGYHFVYKCLKVGGNDKLAYNAKNEVLIETRGKGGLLFIAPSNGYVVHKGEFKDIPTITIEERELLMNVARSLNFRGIKRDETNEEVQTKAILRENNNIGNVVWSWQDYNSKDDCLQLLENEGWKRWNWI